MRLIDAEELLKILQKQQQLGNVNDSRGRAKAILEVIHAPTVDAEPVKHGKWFHDMEGYARCSCCNEHEQNEVAFFFTYCPNCGARMDGDVK